jgi:hypothetical protein
MLQIVALVTNNSRGVIYDHNIIMRRAISETSCVCGCALLKGIGYRVLLVHGTGKVSSLIHQNVSYHKVTLTEREVSLPLTSMY